jgi:hypothetical protein
MNPYSLRELGELPPCALRRPPDDPASEKNDGSERKPSVEAGRDDALAKREHRKNHGEVVRSRKSTVRPPAAPCVQDAGCPHPRERNNPDHHTCRRCNEQPGKHGAYGKPPRQYVGAYAPKPIGCRFRLDIRHDQLPCAATCRRAARVRLLNRRARHVGIGVAALGPADHPPGTSSQRPAYVNRLCLTGHHRASAI